MDSLCKNKFGTSPIMEESIQKQLFKSKLDSEEELNYSPPKQKIDQSVSVFDNLKNDLFSQDNTKKQLFCESDFIGE